VEVKVIIRVASIKPNTRIESFIPVQSTYILRMKYLQMHITGSFTADVTKSTNYKLNAVVCLASYFQVSIHSTFMEPGNPLPSSTTFISRRDRRPSDVEGCREYTKNSRKWVLLQYED
jgi:hypothetical protein